MEGRGRYILRQGSPRGASAPRPGNSLGETGGEYELGKAGENNGEQNTTTPSRGAGQREVQAPSLGVKVFVLSVMLESCSVLELSLSRKSQNGAGGDHRTITGFVGSRVGCGGGGGGPVESGVGHGGGVRGGGSFAPGASPDI